MTDKLEQDAIVCDEELKALVVELKRMVSDLTLRVVVLNDRCNTIMDEINKLKVK